MAQNEFYSPFLIYQFVYHATLFPSCTIHNNFIPIFVLFSGSVD